MRQATLPDAPRLAEIHVASWQAAYRGIVPDSALDRLSVERGREAWERRLADDTDETLVFDRDGRVRGFVCCGASRDEDADEGTGEIYAIYVDPEEWGRGYGSALAEAAMASLRQNRCAEVTLWVLQDNERAKGFYEAMGFEPDGAEKVETWRDRAELHAVRYRRALAAGPGAA